MTRVQVSHLKAATWFHWRLGLEFMGNTVYSIPVPVYTLRGVPDPPSNPRILVQRPQQKATGTSNRPPRIKVSWAPPQPNGAAIEKYHVQLKETNSNQLVSSPMRERAATPKSKHEAEMEKHLSFKPGDLPTPSNPADLQGWVTIYVKQYSECLLPEVPSGLMEWKIRIRSRNVEGWSKWSTPTLINRQNTPSIFQNSVHSLSDSMASMSSELPELQLPDSAMQAADKGKLGSKGNPRDEYHPEGLFPLQYPMQKQLASLILKNPEKYLKDAE